MPDKEIQEAISNYLESRQEILNVGKKYPNLIGGNDNIIGRIGEYIALRFLESIGQKPIKAEGKSNPGFDFIEDEILTQVKVITCENEKGKSVRLIKPWSQFVLIQLDEKYRPSVIGVLTELEHNKALEENISWSKTPIVKLTMLGKKGLIGKYGKLHHGFQIST